MWAPEGKQAKIWILGALTALTLATHYGWVVEPLFGHVHWFHALHGRFCYIPIVVAASWFGLRGGLILATVISLLVLPLVWSHYLDASDFVGEAVELIFYYFIAILVGALVDREFLARRKQVQAELQVERAHALSLAGQVAAGVAHEIKNPLASIKGAADIIIDDNTSVEDKQEFKAILHNEVRRIDASIDEFLSFARPRKTVLKEINFSEVVSSCIKQMATQSEQAGIRLKGDITEQLIINGDAEKLHQMTLNLILNAIQASSDSGAISVSLQRGDGQTVILSIKDAGDGMTADELKHLFEPFYSTKASGTGLGLAIVKSIVDDHSGNISIDSNLKSGTTVNVSLPLMK